MTKQRFLEGLKEALTGELSAGEINNQLLYYERYINEQVALGKSEQQVLEELGEPRLIAKTIIETNSGNYSGNGTYYYTDTQQVESEQTSGNWNEKLNSILRTVCVVLVILFILAIIFSVIRILLPIVIPVVLVVAVISWIQKNK